ncbi:MAG TPA: DUF2252 family protein [Solirubrobacteraceae bacterium]
MGRPSVVRCTSIGPSATCASILRRDRAAIAAYLGKSSTFERAITEFAAAYADQNERDYAAFRAAIASGRLQAATGL